MSRWTLVDKPAALPGECFLCRSPVGPFIDTGQQWDVYGAVYLGVECIAEMARMLGFATPDQVARETAEHAAVTADLDAVRGQLAELAVVAEVLESYAERRGADGHGVAGGDHGGGDGGDGGRRDAARRQRGGQADGDRGGPVRPAVRGKGGGARAGAEPAAVRF